MPTHHSICEGGFADLVRYTAMVRQDSINTLELVWQSKNVQKTMLEKCNGKLLKEMRDAAMAQFGAALDVVKFGLKIQNT